MKQILYIIFFLCPVFLLADQGICNNSFYSGVEELSSEIRDTTLEKESKAEADQESTGFLGKIIKNWTSRLPEEGLTLHIPGIHYSINWFLFLQSLW